MTATAGSRLRVALIWHDEVMDDVVLDEPGPITLGSDGKSTFVVPELGLPQGFTIIRPGSRGYLLALSERMRGTVSVDGAERDVADVVRSGGGGGGAVGGFAATAIGGRDWGVIDLDAGGVVKLYFQFVPREPPLPLAVLALELMLPAFVFSVILHAILLAVTYKFDTGEDPFTWPGPRALTGSYLVTRIETAPPEPKKKTPAGPAAASKQGKVEHIKSATKGREGKAGGEGKQPRARNPNAKDVPPTPPKVALFEDKNRAVVDNIINHDLATSLGKFSGLQGPHKRGGIGSGRGHGTGFGEGTGTGTTRGSHGNGPGGGGSVEGDFVSQGKIDTGETRAPRGHGGHGSGVKEVAVVGTGTASGDFTGLSKGEIDRVIKHRAGLIRACYQKQLDLKGKALGGGKLEVHFVIDAGGNVTSTRIKSSQIHDAKVESCVRSQIARLKFPAKGGAIVNYPFIFSQG